MDPHTVRDALALACRAPSVHNTQPWRWLIGHHSVHLMADRTRAVPATDPDGRDLLISCGAALHHLRVALAGLGLASRTRVLPNPADPDHLAAVETHHRAPGDSDIAMASAIERRRTDRRRYSSWPVPTEYLDLLAERAAAEGALLVPATEPRDHRALVTSAGEAAAIQESDPAHHREMVLWSGRRGGADGVRAAAAPTGPARPDEPPNRAFPMGALRPAPTGRGEPDGSCLLVLGTPGDDPESRLRAGVAASAVLLTATGLGLATCPLSQPLEVPGPRAAIRTGLLGDAAFPHLVLRVGFAPVSADHLPASPRRPLGEVSAPLPGVARPY